MRHWRGLIEKDYLGAWDLVDREGRAREFTLRIAGVESVSLKTREQPKGKRKAVVTFERAEKRFVANTTNCETIESLYGPDVDRWVGELVTLYQTDVRNPKGGTIKGIRVRPKKPTGKAEPIAAVEVDEAMRAAQNEAFDRPDKPAREPGED